jgi:ATP-binding cassette, subfamily B, bacterial
MSDQNTSTPAAGGDPAHLLRLLQFLVPYRWRVAGALVALVTAAGCVLALGQGLRFVIDAGFGSGNPAMLNTALAGVIAVATVLAAATYTRFYLMMTVGERVIADLRRAVFAHVLRLSPAFFDASRTGEIVSRLTNDSEQLRQVIGFGLSMFLRNGLMMVGAAVCNQPQTRRADRARRAGDAGADTAGGAARAPPVARQSGPRGRSVGAYR